MRTSILQQRQKQFERAVCSLCPVIETRVNANAICSWTEYSLRRELVACILGSQVRHEMATTALDRIEQAGLLSEIWWCSTDETFEAEIKNALSGRTQQYEKKWSYRFPNVRARQLAEARNAIVKRSLTARMCSTADPKQIRNALVADIAGLGPKQASMFLRNIGKSYDIAILDTHVLGYMEMQSLLQFKRANISSTRAYEQVETIFTKYADELGFRVGLLDWAIWTTMRAAWELGL